MKEPRSEIADEAGWAFGAFELRAVRGLACQGTDVGLAAKPLTMLEYLLRHRDRVVPRDELLEHVWPGVSVSGAAFDSVVRDLRRALGDSATAPTHLATVRARGLRFIAAVEALPAEDSSAWRRAAVHFERALAALELIGRGSARATSGRAT